MNREAVVMVPVEVRQRGAAVRGLVLPLAATQLSGLEVEQERVALESYRLGTGVDSSILVAGVRGLIVRQALGRLAKGRGAMPSAASPGALFLRWARGIGGLILFHGGHRFFVICPGGYVASALKAGTVRVVQL